MNTKKADKHLPSSLISLFDLHKHNQDNQEKLLGGPFESSKQLYIFKHGFKVAMHVQAHWKQIIRISTAEGIKDILTNFMLIDENNLKGTRLKRSPEEATAAKNIYIVLWKSFACPIKTAMQIYANNNKIDGPALLCHLLRQYTGTAESVIRTYQLNLNNLTDKIEELGFDVDKFCNYTAKTLKTLHDAGGEIRAYKVVVSAKDKTLNFTNLTTITRTKYMSH
eukprot:6793943-Ditylum_brightwellii.AAC.1